MLQTQQTDKVANQKFCPVGAVKHIHNLFTMIRIMFQHNVGFQTCFFDKFKICTFLVLSVAAGWLDGARDRCDCSTAQTLASHSLWMLQCSAVHHGAVQCSAVQCSAV